MNHITPEANMIGAIVPLLIASGGALVFAIAFENKHAQRFIRGLTMFLTMVMIYIPFLLYLRETGVNVPAFVNVIVWSIFACIALIATVSWR